MARYEARKRSLPTRSSGAIGTNVTAVTQNSAGSTLQLNGASTFTGTTSILSGNLVQGNATALGSGNTTSILLGDTTGSSNATFSLGASGSTLARNVGLALLGALVLLVLVGRFFDRRSRYR